VFLLKRMALLGLAIVLLVVWLEKATGPVSGSPSALVAALLWGARGAAILATGWAIFTIRTRASSTTQALSGGAKRRPRAEPACSAKPSRSKQPATWKEVA